MTSLTPPLLSAVVVARNEERLIAACIESVLEVGRRFEGFDAVVVDSRSTDRTVEITRRYPVTTARILPGIRCTAALARSVGQKLTRSQHILFVDGDTIIEAEWVQRAVALLAAEPAVAGVAGKLGEVYYRNGERVGETADFFGMGAVTEEVYQLGGNAVYRRAALDEVGSFHAGVISYEEAELAGRLRQNGYRLVRLPVTLGTHHTGARDSWEECWRRFRSGLMVGQGQVLRLSFGTHLFWAHARALNRYLFCTAFLLLGLLLSIFSIIWSRPQFAIAWLGSSMFLGTAFVLQSRGIRRPLGVLADWILTAPAMVWGFAVGPVPTDGVVPERLVEILPPRARRRPDAEAVQC